MSRVTDQNGVSRIFDIFTFLHENVQKCAHFSVITLILLSDHYFFKIYSQNRNGAAQSDESGRDQSGVMLVSNKAVFTTTAYSHKPAKPEWCIWWIKQIGSSAMSIHFGASPTGFTRTPH